MARDTVRVSVLKTDPLPVVNVRVNGGTKSPSSSIPGVRSRARHGFAKELGSHNSGRYKAPLSGGQHAEGPSGGLSPHVGRWTIKNLPDSNASFAPTLGKD